MRGCVPRMLRSAFSAFTRVFDALRRCAADPGSIVARVPALRCTVKNAAPRPGHRRHCFTLSQDEATTTLNDLRLAADQTDTHLVTAAARPQFR
jgi:hypothetical protein